MSEKETTNNTAHVEANAAAALENLGIKTVTHADGTISTAAGNGQVATDAYGNPLVTFDDAAVRRLRWKLDLYTVPTVALLYLFCFIDRANIGNARIAGMEQDLQLEGFDYNVILSVFYISYIIFEIPCNIFCKWIGPGWFIPGTSLAFGLISIFTAFVQTQAQMSAIRFLLGIFEAGMLPGIAYYLSRWYQRAELTFRLSLYMVMAPLAGAFGGLLASAILTMDSFGSLTSWRMIFAVEGVITVGLAIIGFFTLTDRPETARWLSQEEKELCIARVKSERVGATEVLDKLDRTKLWRGMTCPVTLQISVIFLFNNITVQGLAFFLPTIVRTIYPEYTVVQQQLHSVPPYAVGAFFVLAFPALSWYLDRRQVLIALSAPMVMAGYIMFLASNVAQVRYAATFLIASSTMVLGPMGNAHISANVVSDSARSSAIGLNVMMGNIGGLVATWSFIVWDAPDYPIGNGLNLAAATVILIVSTSFYFWMKWDNKRRDGRSVEEELAGMSQKEVSNLDWKHPGFRWRT
ncbi:MFS general substrate transporter [Sodiomyces alkalinus F11]|uniref:MFS general substrate transporter n=1 Tax=Sodiomyces alkalinus (strain CBS 110278 / VKM F-3762 / F11) TaxID=1314773 RepID=A0A3N2PP94_SODAK|nr:MFS general substrate transporter [Sodiomyces alkalinus F11]ROT36166.1 MFS general substrate transporter [Sodiomyces alkalinus F11]